MCMYVCVWGGECSSLSLCHLSRSSCLSADTTEPAACWKRNQAEDRLLRRAEKWFLRGLYRFFFFFSGVKAFLLWRVVAGGGVGWEDQTRRDKNTALLFLVFHNSGGCQSLLRKMLSPAAEEFVLVYIWVAAAGGSRRGIGERDFLLVRLKVIFALQAGTFQVGSKNTNTWEVQVKCPSTSVRTDSSFCMKSWRVTAILNRRYQFWWTDGLTL